MWLDVLWLARPVSFPDQFCVKEGHDRPCASALRGLIVPIYQFDRAVVMLNLHGGLTSSGGVGKLDQEHIAPAKEDSARDGGVVLIIAQFLLNRQTTPSFVF